MYLGRQQPGESIDTVEQRSRSATRPERSIYIRDENTGEFWSPTWPSAGAGRRRWFGTAKATRSSSTTAIVCGRRCWNLLPLQDPIKFVRLKLKNVGCRPRRLSATFYAEWVLGTDREQTAMHIVTAVDPDSGAVLARNPFNDGLCFARGFRRRRLCGHELLPRTALSSWAAMAACHRPEA